MTKWCRRRSQAVRNRSMTGSGRAVSPARPPVVENGAVVATEPYIYRYVYEPDRILVIDPSTGVAVQSIPR